MKRRIINIKYKKSLDKVKKVQKCRSNIRPRRLSTQDNCVHKGYDEKMVIALSAAKVTDNVEYDFTYFEFTVEWTFAAADLGMQCR